MTHAGCRAVLSGIGLKHRSVEAGGLRRGTLVLEHELYLLERALRGANFTVVVPEDAAMSKQRKLLLSGRVLVTRRTPAFVADAPAFNLGIIGLDKLPHIYVAATPVMISKVFSDFDLGSERGSYLLLLHSRGRHVFRRLI